MQESFLQNMPTELYKKVAERAWRRVKQESNSKNSCVILAGNRNLKIQIQKNKKIYNIGVRSLLFFDTFKTLKTMSFFLNPTCKKYCVNPQHSFHIKEDPKKIEKKERERQRENVIKRIVKQKDGCWSHLGASDVLFENKVTTMRAAVRAIYFGKIDGIDLRARRNKESCNSGCINPDHGIYDIYGRERYLSLCTTINTCVVYNGKMNISRVRLAFYKQSEETNYKSYKRGATCHIRCVEPTHRIKIKDDKELFLNRVDKNQNLDDCWRFHGCHITRIKGVATTIRRASWILFRKGKPGRLLVKKTCENWCVNPQHLVNART